MIELSKRLQCIASLVTQGNRVADIGSDHALLPVFLLLNNISPLAIAGELNEGPFAAAKAQVASAGLQDRIAVRKGNGLAVIMPEEADTVTIAGMGGALMCGILEQGRQQGKLTGVSELVLQPNVAEDQVRAWLVRHDWYLAEEHILEEDGKIYEVLLAQRQTQASLDNETLYADLVLCDGIVMDRQKLLMFGPHLIRHPDQVWFDKWKSEAAKRRRIVSELAKSSQTEAKEKAVRIEEARLEIEEVLACLQMRKPSFK